jgi:hypothetical protein
MSINTKSMFEAIKQSLSSDKKEGGGNGLYKEIMKFSAGNTYQVRLVPNPNSPKETIFHYYNHGWNSNATGKYVTALCPTTFGETCPIDAFYLKTYRTGTESEKESARVLSRKEAWMVNVYVISDPETPENEGKVKILRYGKELAKIIESALEGDDVKEFGVEKVFDVANGSTLRIKCESRTGAGRGGKQMVTYASSKFLSPSDLDLEENDVQKIYESVHDLKAVNKQTTPAEMQRLLDEHFFNLTTGSSVEDNSDDEYAPIRNEKPTTTKKSAEAIESVFENVEAAPNKPSNKASVKDDVNETDESTDEALKKLLADL